MAEQRRRNLAVCCLLLNSACHDSVPLSRQLCYAVHACIMPYNSTAGRQYELQITMWDVGRFSKLSLILIIFVKMTQVCAMSGSE